MNGASAHFQTSEEPMAERKNALETAPQACALCGGEVVVVDIASGAETVSLVGENSGRFVSRDASVPVERAWACTICGHTQFFVDAEKLRRRIVSRFSR